MLCWTVGVCGPSTSWAEAPAPDPEPAGYRAAIEGAVAEFAAGHAEEARSLFHRAHTLHPNARTFRGLGMVEFELRNYAECIAQLTAALASNVRPLEGTLRSDTQELLTRARNFVAEIRIEATPEPSRIIVDGVPVERATGQALMLEVGDHVLEVRAPGCAPEKRVLRVTGGESPTLTFVLERSATESVMRPAARADADERAGRAWYRSPWLWTSVSVVVLGAAVGAALLLQPAPTRRIEPLTSVNTPPGATLRGLVAW